MITKSASWALELLIAGGITFIGGYLVNKAINANKDLCIDELPEPMRTQTLEAVKTNDKKRLSAYAVQADIKGWKCAANEMRTIVNSIDAKIANNSLSPITSSPSNMKRADIAPVNKVISPVTDKMEQQKPHIIESKPITSNPATMTKAKV